MPVGDWQFWVVSILAIGGAVLLFRQFRPVRRKKAQTQLTISAKKRD